ncbi:MAG: twin-arginine translocase subunit TatC [Chitinivibrionales bacterium]|nr:twin-arginine translocase subunit TatC [Chitinivibrionales bacterium]
MAEEQSEMSFWDHLEELRWRLIKSIIAVVVCAIPCGIFWRRIFDIVMVYPLSLSDPRPKLIFTAPAEAIILSLKIAVAGGIIIACPIIFYQLWKFIAPGLYKSEKVVVLPTVIVSSLSFLLGIGFSYLVLPYVLKFLAGYASGSLEPFFKANEYMGFIIKIVLAFGSVFELPVISFALTKLGVLTPKILLSKFKYALVIMFIMAALLTPPDIISQLFLAGPLITLYFISVLVSWIALNKQKNESASLKKASA